LGTVGENRKGKSKRVVEQAKSKKEDTPAVPNVEPYTCADLGVVGEHAKTSIGNMEENKKARRRHKKKKKEMFEGSGGGLGGGRH